MIDIFSYHDYRIFLKDKYEALKFADSKITYRAIAKNVGFQSAGFFTNIINGKRNISESTTKAFSTYFNFNKREHQYFELLVLGQQAKIQSQKKFFLDKAIQLKNYKLHTREVGSHLFYNKWYYSAIREILDFYPFKNDFKKLARMVQPSIKPKEAEEAIRLLTQLNMIKKDKDGTWIPCEPLISSGREITSATLAKFHIETSELAIEAIDKLDPSERNISTLTLSISDENYQIILQKLRTFRKEILAVAESDKKANRAYHMNFHLFPLSKKQ